MSDNLIALQNRFLGRGETVYDRLATLHAEHGEITDAHIAHLAAELSLPAVHVRTVAKFYDELQTEQRASKTLRLCNGEACVAAGASGRHAEIVADLAQLDGDVAIGEVSCLGYCGRGPNAVFEQHRDGHLGRHVLSLADGESAQQIAEILRSEAGFDGAAALAFPEPENACYRASDPRADVLLRNFDHDMAILEVARQRGAYEALAKALSDVPERIIEEVKLSGLRGRGGAGFPTGLKLETVRTAAQRANASFVVVNADEGDAGAYIDKELIERDPHAVLEGALLAAYAVGAAEVIIYLRAEYPRAHRVLVRAIDDAQEANLIGADILGQGFRCEVRLVRGHGAYICGEETSLLRSLEGVPAQVSPKPPYPALEGLRGQPTAVNNVETLAALPFIVGRGGTDYAQLGHGKSRGTKLVSLNAAVTRPGLYEVELGITLREIIFDLAGGMAAGRQFGAVQIGGPLGGILGEAQLDLRLDFEALAGASAMLGHAGMVVFAADVDLVRIGHGLMRFCAVESCGKCFPCRLGSVRGKELFDKILEGRADQADLDLLAELSATMRAGSLCALGGGIPTPIDNLLTTFIEAFRRYIPDARTPVALRR